MWHQAMPRLGEYILHSRGNFGIDLAGNQPVRLQGTERHGEHALRHVADGFLYVAEAHCAVRVQRNHDEHRPFIAQAAEDVAYGAGSGVMKVFHSLTYTNLLNFSNGYIIVSI